jgi:hypothetical protein
MDDNSPQKLSTSTLAKRLEIPSQQLFVTLKDYGWIRKLEEGWALTSKGEFEGGEYVHSKRYGRYIVWPEELAEHPLFQALEDNRHLSATALGKKVGINARETNRVLAELGWIKHGYQGWELTALGERQGGIQLENDNSGTFYVVWPEALQHDTLLNKQLQLTAEIFLQQPPIEQAIKADLFSAEPEHWAGLDGHVHSSKAQLQICHWLYMAGIAHACPRQLPVNPELYADFYLPAHQIYIECWNDEAGKPLSLRMQRKEIYQQYKLAVIDLEKDDLNHLDEVLTRQFRKHGIRV